MQGDHLLTFPLRLLGESPPPPPRACFGRDELIESILSLAENLNPVALIGAGGIGKTSIALSVLHHGRLKERFGDNRRFIRCDQFTASRANFLDRLSNVIGAGIKGVEDLTALRPALSSKEMLIVLDNAESILDPQLADAQEIYGVVEELSQFTNICLLVTSRVSTIPSTCQTIDVPTLSIEAARDTFYRIYKRGGRSDTVDEIFKQLDFHPLCITLLATVAHQNKWDNNRLTKEWKQRHTDVLQTEHNRSLGATIELSLSSPMFVGLGSDARELLGVIAFFPQGVNEDNVDWLFPAVPNVTTILDKFCMLSLTFRSDGFITMLVPLRDYLCPKDPLSSPLFCATKESYFARLPAKSDIFSPGTKETRWIISEDVNVEHLLNVLASIDMASSIGVWRACADFLCLLRWHKPRQTVLGPKIKRLPDDHHFKFDCSIHLVMLLEDIGYHADRKQLVEHIWKVERDGANNYRIAFILGVLATTNLHLGLVQEGLDQAREAVEIFERIGDIKKHGYSLLTLATILAKDRQLDAADEVASRILQLRPEKDEEYLACHAHVTLCAINTIKGDVEKSSRHAETALEIATRFDWEDQIFWAHLSLANLYFGEEKYDVAIAHAERAKSHAISNASGMAQAINVQAISYYRQGKLERSKFEALRAVEIFERLGAKEHLESCRSVLWVIEEAEEGRDWEALVKQAKDAQEGQDVPVVRFPELCNILRPLIPPQASSRLVRYLPPWKIPLKTHPHPTVFSVPPSFLKDTPVYPIGPSIS